MSCSLRNFALFCLIGFAGLWVFTPSHAATVNFVFSDWADVAADPNFVGEMGAKLITNGVPIDGLTVKITGTSAAQYAAFLDAPDSGILNSKYAYLDSQSGGNPAGLGVCHGINGSKQCVPSNDDNVTAGEVLILEFSEQVTVSDIVFRDANHHLFSLVDPSSDFELFIDHSYVGRKLLSDPQPGNDSWVGTIFSFATDDFDAISDLFLGDEDQLYLTELAAQGTTLPASVVPIPASAWLFGSALGLLAWVRRRATG